MLTALLHWMRQTRKEQRLEHPRTSRSRRSREDSLFDRLIPETLRSLLRDSPGARALSLESYEDRLLYSAAPAPAPAPEAVQAVAVEPVIEPQPATAPELPPGDDGQNAEQARLDLIVIDRAIPEAGSLIARLTALQTDPDRILILDSQRDGLEQIADRLEHLGQTRAIHILSHGDEAGLRLGSNWLSGDTLAYRAGTLASWQPFLAADADVLFYGCDLAANEAGQQVLRSFGELTGADIAASTDATGSALLGGDWNLEFRFGSIEAPSLSEQFSLFDWNGLLATSTYQEGVSSYTGTQDTAVSSTNPTTSYGTSTTVIVGGATDRIGLIRFDSLFGNGPIQIPLGSTIHSASLRLNVTSATSADASITLHRVLTTWSEASTHNSLGSGLALDDMEVSSVADAIVETPEATGSQLIDGLEESLQAWSDGAANLGWAITGNNDTNWAFSSSEAATSSQRPMLLVSYTPPAAATVELRTTGEIRVNAVTTDTQTTLVDSRNAHGTVGIDANGNYVIVWTSSNSDGSGTGVYAQRYNARGVAQGLPIRVNTTTTGDQKWGTVAVKSDGGFIVTWTSVGQDGSGSGNYARIFDSSGVGGSEILVNSTTSGEQYAPSIGTAYDGSFVITWRGNGPGDSTGVFFQRFTALGVKAGGEQRVNTTTTNTQEDPSIAVGQDGQFMVVFDDIIGTYGRRYDASGNALDSNQLLIHADATSGNADVATNGTGDYHIVWRTTGAGDGSGRGLWRLSLGAGDTAAGTPLQVTTDTINDQTEPAISSDADGDFIISWQGSGPGDTAGVFARKFRSDGTAVGTEFQLNETTTGSQVGVSTALVNLDNYVAVWSGQGPGDSSGVFLSAEGTLQNQASILFTTSTNVTGSGSSTVPNWTTGDVLGLGQPNLMLGDNTSGTLSIVGNVNAIANDGNVSLAGLDVIQRDVIVAAGANQVQLYAGDVLFSVANTETLGALTIQSDDILIFRPAAPWNYAAGQISVLFKGIHNVGGGTVNQMADFDLVDIDTQVGDVLLTAGTLVVADRSGSDIVQVFHPTGAGLTMTAGTTQTLLTDTELPLNQVQGLHLVERDIRVGGVNLESGDLLISTSNSTLVGANELAVTRNDVARLQIEQTSINGPAEVTATMLVQGSDVALDTSQESFLSLALVHVGEAPTAQDETYHLTEGQTFNSQDSWHMPGWESRTQLTFNNSSRAENLSDFPILVTLDTNRFDYSQAQISGNDLRFVDADGTVLSYEIETWNPNGQSHIWVKVPQIDAGSVSDSIWMYFGNSSAAAGQNAADVWSNGYVGVWHMNGNPTGTGAIQDSSSSNVDGTSTGMDSTNQTNGPIGGALKFDGSSEYIRVSTTATDPTAVDPSQLTIEAWASSSGNTGFAERIINRRNIVFLTPYESYGLGTSASDGTQLVHSTGSPDLVSTTGALPADRWRYVTGVFSSSTSQLYVDGVLNASQSGVTSFGSGNDDITIGAGEMGLTSTISQYWRGGIDEVRLSNVARSAAWTSAQYASMTDTMITYGDRQTVAGVLDNDTSTAAGGLTVTRVDPAGAADFASITILDDGRLVADPGTAFASLAEGESATRQIQYTIMDARGNSDLGTATLVVHGRNDAPVLNSAVGPLRLADIVEDATSNSGTNVAQILTSAVGTLITDVDAGARQGIAITSAISANGSWQYSLDGSTWSSLTGASTTSATLLDVTARVRFVPNANYSGNAGSISFTAWDQTTGTNGQTGVNASTRGGTTAFSSLSTTASITVTPVNDTPTLTTGPALTVVEGGQITIGSASLQATDIDNSSTGLTYNVTGGLGFGHLERTTAPGTPLSTFTQAEIDSNLIIYVHDGAESLTDYVTVALSDGQSIVTGNLSFSITAVNDAPVFDAYRMTLNEGSTVTLSTANLLTNDPDASATSLVYTVFSVTNGRFERASAPGTAVTTFTQDDVNNGRIRFVHNGGEAAPSASLTVSDGAISVGPRSMSVTFSNVNDSPSVTTNTGLTLSEGGTVTISATKLSTTDSDNTASQLIYTLATSPANGRLESTTQPGVAITSFTQYEVNNGTIRYVHNGGESTSDSFSFSVSDGAATATGSFAIAINAVNDPPALTVNSLPVSEGQTVTLTTSHFDAADADSATLTFSVGGLNRGEFRNTTTGTAVTSFTRAQIAAGVITFTHDGSDSPPTGTIAVSDGSLTTTPTAISFSFMAVNDPPVIGTNAGATVAERGVTTIGSAQLSTLDSDNSAGQLTYTVTTIPLHGRLERSGDPGVAITSFTQSELNSGSIQYVHDGSQTTSDSFSFSVSDGSQPVTGSFAITVTAVNDAPVLVNNTGLTVQEGSQTLIGSPQLSFSDADNSPSQLVYSVSTTPSHGRLERTSNAGVAITSFTQQELNSGTIRYVHDGSETTSDSFLFSVSDGAATVSGSFAITVTPVNDAPVLTTATFTISEGQAITLTAGNLAATDTDHSTLTFQVAGVTHAQFVNSATNAVVTSFTNADIADGRIRFVHDGSPSAPTVTIRVTDGALTTSAVNATINFTAVNDPPALAVNAGGTVAENGSLIIGSGLLSASDEEQSASQLTYTITGVPVGGRLERVGTPGVAISTFTQADLNGGQVRYIHLGGEAGTDRFQFSVSDGTTAITGQFNLTISPVNDAPVLNLGQIMIGRGGTATLTSASIDASDSDSGVLTFTVSNVTSGRFVRIATGVTVTSFTNAQIAAGEIGFKHDGSPTAPGGSIVVSDGSVTTPAQPLLFDFRYINSPPTMTNQTFTLPENALPGTVVGQVVASDSDPLDVLSYSIVEGPSSSLFTIHSTTGRVTVASGTTLDFESQPSHTLTVQVQDRDGALASATLTIQLQNANEAPVAFGFPPIQGQEDGPALSIDLTRGFQDPERSGLTFRVVSTTNTALLQTAAINGAGQLVIQGKPNAHGSTDLTIEATDNGGLTARTTLHVQLAAVNDAPVAVGDSATVLTGSILNISPSSLLSNDTDVDGPGLVVTLLSQPEHGTLTQNPDGTFSYRPEAGYSGTDQFSYAVSDGTASSAPATVSLDVQIVAGSGTGGRATTESSPSTASSESMTAGGDSTSSITSSGTTASSTDGTGTSSSAQGPSSSSTAAGGPQKSNNTEVVGPMASRQNDDETAGFALVRKGMDLSDFGGRTNKASSDGDARRDRGITQTVLNTLETGLAPTSTTQLASSLASLQLTQLRMAFSSQANVAAFEQLATSLNAEMQGELAFEVPALAGASLTVGYVVWMLRGGMLITSLLAQMPAWRIIDPLVVLDSLDKGADDDESLGSLVEHGQSETDPA